MWLMWLSLSLTRAEKMSIESALMPVPLCFGARLMVLHMSPGR